MRYLIFLSFCLLLACTAEKASQLQISNPRIEMRRNPLGMDIEKPRFMWQLTAKENDVYQTAYQILVATSPEELNKENGNVWNSGKVHIDNFLFIPYEGTPLQSRQTYYWKVKAWTNKGETPWSETNH
ncbi:MAG: hypothetical protein LUD02_03150 [Tannerellaceae bacterium]|nr:hypothetical protein [Tannerellaceae bacterium]